MGVGRVPEVELRTASRLATERPETLPGGSFCSVGARLCLASSDIRVLPPRIPNLTKTNLCLEIYPVKTKRDQKVAWESTE